jgi:hypothetical protein
MSAPASTLEKLVAVATLGTRRAPPGRILEWPDDSLAPVGAREQSAETRLLRAAAAGALFDAAGTRAAAGANSLAARDFPAAGTEPVSEIAAWRLARIIGGEHRSLLGEWFSLAAASGRVLPPHLLPLVLEHVPPEERPGAGGVLGPAASWLAARHPRWFADAPVREPSDARWKEGTLRERLTELEAVRRIDRVRSRAWLRTTWEEDAPDAREAFLNALLPTIAPDDEEFLEFALDDKRKSVRQAAAEALSRLPDSAHARRNLASLGTLIDLGAEKGGLLGLGRKRKLVVELPTAPDKAAFRDGIEAKVPANRKIGERAFWLVQRVARVPPDYWCVRFGCDARTFFDAVLATDYAQELALALTEAATRHPRREWALLLAQHWIRSLEDFAQVSGIVATLIASAPPAERADIVEAIVHEANAQSSGYVQHLLTTLDFPWSARLTDLAFDHLARFAAATGGQWALYRNSLDAWARYCDRATGARRGAALFEKCGEGHAWRNALEQFNDIVAFRVAMQQELSR